MAKTNKRTSEKTPSVEPIWRLSKSAMKKFRLPHPKTSLRVPDPEIWKSKEGSAQGGCKVDSFSEKTVAPGIALPRYPDLRHAVKYANEFGLAIVHWDHLSDNKKRHAEAALSAFQAIEALQRTPDFCRATQIGIELLEHDDLTGKGTRLPNDIIEALRSFTLAFRNLPLQSSLDALTRIFDEADPKPAEPGQPGHVYRNGFLDSLATHWVTWTGALPARTYKDAKRSRSPRPRFKEFAMAALQDIGWCKASDGVDHVSGYMLKSIQHLENVLSLYDEPGFPSKFIRRNAKRPYSVT